VPADLTTNSSKIGSPNGTVITVGSVSDTWLFKAKGGTDNDYLPNLFFEGFVDLTNIREAACFQRFMLETRNSASIGASLQDLAAGSFGSVPPRPVVTITEATLCGTETAPSLTVLCPVPATYRLIQQGDQTATAQSFPADAVSGVLRFTNLKAGKGFDIYADADGCASDHTDCSNYTTNSCPPSTASARQADQIQTNTQVAAGVKVLAAPNPFNDKIRFSVESSVSGQGVLELYNMLGQKVKTVFEGYVEKGKMQVIEYKVAAAQRSGLSYLFIIGDQKATGKLIGLK
jgi:hypothetical protein